MWRTGHPIAECGITVRTASQLFLGGPKMLAELSHNIEDDDSVRLRDIGQPSREGNCLVVSARGAFRKQFGQSHPQALRQSLQSRKRRQCRASLEARDGFGVNADPFGKLRLCPISLFSKCCDVAAKVIQQSGSASASNCHICRPRNQQIWLARRAKGHRMQCVV